jgi:hypothetical protein
METMKIAFELLHMQAKTIELFDGSKKRAKNKELLVNFHGLTC